MCNACGFFCCASDEFEGCGCDQCPCPECWTDDDEWEWECESDDDWDDGPDYTDGDAGRSALSQGGSDA